MDLSFTGILRTEMFTKLEETLKCAEKNIQTSQISFFKKIIINSLHFK